MGSSYHNFCSQVSANFLQFNLWSSFHHWNHTALYCKRDALQQHHICIWWDLHGYIPYANNGERCASNPKKHASLLNPSIKHSQAMNSLNSCFDFKMLFVIRYVSAFWRSELSTTILPSFDAIFYSVQFSKLAGGGIPDKSQASINPPSCKISSIKSNVHDTQESHQCKFLLTASLSASPIAKEQADSSI